MMIGNLVKFVFYCTTLPLLLLPVERIIQELYCNCTIRETNKEYSLIISPVPVLYSATYSSY
jgi:hypothetical protein